MTTEEKFEKRVCENLQLAQQRGLFRTAGALVQIRRYGAAAWARGCFSRCRCCDGFEELAQAGELRLSVEALAAGQEFGGLFSDEEVNFCLQALLSAGYYG